MGSCAGNDAAGGLSRFDGSVKAAAPLFPAFSPSAPLKLLLQLAFLKLALLLKLLLRLMEGFETFRCLKGAPASRLTTAMLSAS